jgi:maleate cis-trans isomerase
VIRARIGVLVPSGNPIVEPEFYRMAPTGVTIHFARLDSGAGVPGTPEAMEQRTLGYLDAVPGGIRSLVDLGPAVIVLAHTAVSYLNGAVGEAALAARLTKLAGTRATTAAGAVTAGLRQLGVKRLALATPYPESISAAGRAFWEASGVRDRRLPSAPRRGQHPRGDRGASVHARTCCRRGGGRGGPDQRHGDADGRDHRAPRA